MTLETHITQQEIVTQDAPERGRRHDRDMPTTGSREMPRVSALALSAATGAVAAVMLILAFTVGRHVISEWSSPGYSTSIGERDRVELEDGSVVQLNTRTDLRVRFTAQERRIVLLKGEARFTVAKEHARPFIVTTSHASVRAVGTVFNVRLVSNSTAVAVLEGQVELNSAASAPLSTSLHHRQGVRLLAGQRAAVDHAEHVRRNAGPSFERAASWPAGYLNFQDERLLDVVNEFNRYYSTPLLIADSELAGLPIRAGFQSNDRASFLEWLELQESVEATHTPRGIVLSRR